MIEIYDNVRLALKKYRSLEKRHVQRDICAMFRSNQTYKS